MSKNLVKIKILKDIKYSYNSAEEQGCPFFTTILADTDLKEVCFIGINNIISAYSCNIKINNEKILKGYKIHVIDEKRPIYILESDMDILERELGVNE